MRFITPLLPSLPLRRYARPSDCVPGEMRRLAALTSHIWYSRQGDRVYRMDAPYRERSRYYT